MLAVFTLVEVFSQQRLLFVSLVASAFAVYHDPHHKTNHIATFLVAQIGAAGLVIVMGVHARLRLPRKGGSSNDRLCGEA